MVRVVHLKYKLYHVIPLLKTTECFPSHTEQGPTMAYKVLHDLPSSSLLNTTSMTLSPIAFPLFTVLRLPCPFAFACIFLSVLWHTLPQDSCMAHCSPPSRPHLNVTLLFKISPPYHHFPQFHLFFCFIFICDTYHHLTCFIFYSL